jgi:uncharacterized membrane protein (UPF0127 family)
MTPQRIQLLLFFIFVPLGILFWYLHQNDISLDEFTRPMLTMRIGDFALKIEVAETHEARVQGLSGRDSLDADGLLFVFPETDYHGIWMKDMRFPIDIIWISEDLRIVHIEENVQPETYPKVFRPREPARYVLETDSRYVATFGFTVGQEVTLPARLIDPSQK